jgi:hypothetical protein
MDIMESGACHPRLAVYPVSRPDQPLLGGEGFSKSRGEYRRLERLSHPDSGNRAIREVTANATKGDCYPAEDNTYEVVRGYPSSLSSESGVYNTR